jgi:hypothetical protein
MKVCLSFFLTKCIQLCLFSFMNFVESLDLYQHNFFLLYDEFTILLLQNFAINLPETFLAKSPANKKWNNKIRLAFRKLLLIFHNGCSLSIAQSSNQFVKVTSWNWNWPFHCYSNYQRSSIFLLFEKWEAISCGNLSRNFWIGFDFFYFSSENSK